MGLIGTLFTAVTGVPGQADRALLDTLCLAGAADGASSELEEGYALGIALELTGFQKVSREKLERQIADARAAIRDDGDPKATMARIAKALDSDDLREQAFALAAVIVAVDLDVRDIEHAFLRTFRAELDVSDGRASAIWAEINRELDEVRRGDAPRPGS